MAQSTYTTPSVIASFDAANVLSSADGYVPPGNGSQIVYN